MEDDENQEKPKKFFSQEVWKEPCFRDTMIVGSSSGLISGLATFIFTSSGRKMFHASFLGFLVPYIGYGTFCWYTTSKQQAYIDKINETIAKIDKDEPI
ncbi:cytochrome c oxidase assembly protein COX20, mitochondrial-like [Mytilus californianus]|uniref:cytochrome c oxidase assembly protein COX20, mitochondrial-like n=1 Tax=Mytilus californianus TaxID=6549 RepID=UPI00224527C4|nr:cytochrome c oxidase assembly protein COX20, mitochondrial-like [Mytilus californianus]